MTKAMAQSKIRRALGKVKDKTSIGLAKVGTTHSNSDLDVAIVKATRHEELPAEEKHIREILNLTSYSNAHVSACVDALFKRLNKTRNWTVALKTLIVIHRLLSEGDPSYEQEIFFTTRRGTRLLNMSDFRDKSHPDTWDFSVFVRTFALYLDGRLEFRMRGRRNGRRVSVGGGDDEEEGEPAPSVGDIPLHDLKIKCIFTRAQRLQQFLERFLACRPTGAAKSNRVVIVALRPLVKESFQTYFDITEIMGILVDRFMELEILDCMKVFEIFSRIAIQFDELDTFYSWCKSAGVARSSEYPEVEKITPKKLEVMDELIRDKSILVLRRKEKSTQEPKIEIYRVEQPIEDDLMNIRALPAPESFIEEVAPEEEKKEESIKEEKENNNIQEEADFLNLREGAVRGEKKENELALALFAGDPADPPPTWEAFTDDPTDWETALVQSASSLSNPKAALGGVFDILLLDGMYQQAAAAGAGEATSSGSASSMAFLGRRPVQLALPAPPVGEGGGDGEDPFTASLAVPPPPYVQMSEMEKKQQLLVEEQLVWQQYARDGMQGQLQLEMKNLQSNPFAVGGGYT